MGVKHLIIHIIRVMYGLILYRDTFPGGPVAYFSAVSQWTFYGKNLVYIAQTVVGDGVIVRFVLVNEVRHRLSALQLYRCYIVWQSKTIMIFPVLLWCSAAGMCNMLLGWPRPLTTIPK